MPRTITKNGQWNSTYKNSFHAGDRKEAYEKGLVGKTGAVAMPAQAVETRQTQGLAKGADALFF